MSKKIGSKTATLVLILCLFAGLAFAYYLFVTLKPLRLNTYGLDGSPVTTAPVSFTLNVSSPDDNALVFDSNLLIQGKTSPNAVVILSFEQTDQAIEANANGDFSTTIQLAPGNNPVSITAFDSNGNTKTENRSIFYSTEKL